MWVCRCTPNHPNKCLLKKLSKCGFAGAPQIIQINVYKNYQNVGFQVHPKFRFTPQADRYDVAVIRLDVPVHYEPHIQPICLPDKGTDFLGHYGWAAGWGALKPGEQPKISLSSYICEYGLLFGITGTFLQMKLKDMLKNK